MTFTVAANSGGVRLGSLTIAGQTATVTQSAASTSPLCTYSVSPTHDSIGANGGTGTTIVVSSPDGCSWNASTDSTWIAIVSGAVGSGNGSVVYVASPNSGARRSGMVFAGDKPVAIDQAAAPCDYSIVPTSQNIGASGGAGTAVSVTARADCTWTASSEASWLTITSGASGTGNGGVQFTAAANTGGARTGDLIIAGRRASIAQATAAAPPPPPPPPPACTFSIAPESATIGSTGGPGTAITVTTTAGCTWTATSTAPWLTITSGASGTGGGTVGYSAAANTGAQRTGDLTVAGHAFTVTQSAAPPPPCTYSIAPGSTTIAASGGAGSPVTVTTAAGCTWTATSNAPWLTITSGASGTGGGTVGYSAAANTGAQRTGDLTVAGHAFTVTQSAAPPPPCTYSIAPGSTTIAASGGAGSPVTVTTAAGCTWTATSNAPWLTITSGASSTGGGTVGFSATANTGAQRMGTLTIAGQTFTVTQSQACAYTINPTSQTAPAGGGAGTAIAVSAANGCAWAATSNAPWLTVTSGASGSGNGSVAFTIAANTGAQRTGTLTVAGQTFTVTQSAAPPPCTYSIAPMSQSIGKNGGNGMNINVTATAGCSWTAVSNASWISIRSGESGTGNGSVSFRVAANDGGQRVGTMTIAGQTFTVTQAAQ